jgi:hypothetical protein
VLGLGRTSLRAIVIVAVVALAGCGKSSQTARCPTGWTCYAPAERTRHLAVVQRPNYPLRECVQHVLSETPCAFDARALLGLKLLAAETLAKRHGLTVRRVKPLRGDEALTADLSYNRLDVETVAPNDDSVVLRIVGRG